MNLRTNERTYTKRNELNETMPRENTVITVDANVVSVESHDIPSAADIPGVTVPEPKNRNELLNEV